METIPNRFNAVFSAPVLMTWPERVILYGLVFSLRPKRCLELGTAKGGSALITVAALDDIGEGKLVCVDSAFQVTPEHQALLAHRATFVAGISPAVLPKAAEAAGGSFDFALIDADHEAPGVIRDIEGTLPMLSDSAFMLCHDAHHHGVIEGIGDILRRYPNNVVDCGLVSVEPTPDINNPGVVWGGMRLLRYKR